MATSTRSSRVTRINLFPKAKAHDVSICRYIIYASVCLPVCISMKRLWQTLKQHMLDHWTIHPHENVKTSAQIAAERHLLYFPRWRPLEHPKSPTTVEPSPDYYWIVFPQWYFHRYYLYLIAFLTQICVGCIAAWSVNNKPIDAYLETQGRAVYTYYFTVAAFGFSSAIFSPWLERTGPRVGMVIGTSTFLLGQVITAISLEFKCLSGMYIGYGFFSGMGLGMNFVCPVSALQKWFPEARGKAAGVAVGGFGAGAVLWARVYLPLQDQVGLPASFVVLGLVMSSVMYCAALILRTPPTIHYNPASFSSSSIMLMEKHHHICVKETGEDERQEAALTLTTPVSSYRLQHSEAAYHHHHHCTSHHASPIISLSMPSSISLDPTCSTTNNNIPMMNQTNHRNTPRTDIACRRKSECEDIQDPGSAPVAWQSMTKTLPLNEAITSRDFVGIYVAFLANQIFGLLIVSRLANMVVDLFGHTEDQAANIVSVNGLFNCVGRVLVPVCSDVVIRRLKLVHVPARGRQLVLVFMLLTQLVIVSCLSLIISQDHYGWFILTILIVSVCYGGGYGLVACFLTDMFGASNVGAMYGLTMTAQSINAVAGGLGFSSIYNHQMSRSDDNNLNYDRAYLVNIPWILAMLCIGFVAILFVRTTSASVTGQTNDTGNLVEQDLILEEEVSWCEEDRMSSEEVESRSSTIHGDQIIVGGSSSSSRSTQSTFSTSSC